jgi:hypothetical protein
MAYIADSGFISPSLKDNFLPSWMYLIIAFYVGAVWISDRLLPLLKDIYDLFKKSSDP